MSYTSADYKKCGLPEFDCNPLISALPPVLTDEEAVLALSRRPMYDPGVRSLPAHLRQHAVNAILHLFQPLSQHIDLEDKFSRMIRAGYERRIPTDLRYFATASENARKVSLESKSTSAALGFNLVGTSGAGKTTAINRILDLYPQVIEHTRYKGQDIYHVQLVWLKLECPHDGSIKAICYHFLEKVDEALGTSYRKLYKSRSTLDELIPIVAQTAGNHTLGALVIDEIQHLSTAKSGGSSRMLNFFVELTNRMSMPVMLVGTPKAISLMSRELRSARRACGQGEAIWYNIPQNEEWEILLEGLWEYQYTKNMTPLTAEISDVLYDECQGITDFAVKLYMLSQIRAISQGIEIITPALIRSVASDSLESAKPFLYSLRTRDFSSLANYEDVIVPIGFAREAKRRTPSVPKSKKTASSQASSVEDRKSKKSASPRSKQSSQGPTGIASVHAESDKDSNYSKLEEKGLIADKDELD